MNILTGAFVILILLVILARTIRIAGENERFAIFIYGRFERFGGPGIVFNFGNSQLVRLRVGDIGEVTGPEFIRFGETDVPVAQAQEFEHGDSVRIVSFKADGPFLTRSSAPVKQRCPKCGHEY